MKRKRFFTKTASIILGIVIICGLILFAGTSDILELAKNVSLTWIIIATIISSSAWLFRSLFIKTHTQFSLFECFKITSISYMMNALLPAKAGDINIIHSLKKRGISLARSINILIHYRIMDLMSLFSISVILLIFYLKEGFPENLLSYLIILGVMLLIPIIFFLDRKGLIIKFLQLIEMKISGRFLKNLVNRSKGIYSDYADLIQSKKLKSFIYSLSAWLIEGTVSFTISIAVGYPVIFPLILLSFTIGNISKIIPLTPGGLGIYEATVILVLGTFGIPISVATLIAIIDHTLKTILGILTGSLVIIYEALFINKDIVNS